MSESGPSRTARLITVGGFGLAGVAVVTLLAVGPGGLFGTDGRPGGAGAATSPHTAGARPDPGPASPHGELGAVGHEYWLRVDSLERSLEQDPDDAPARLRLARLLHDAHELDDAAPHYERLLELDSPERQVWFDLASVYAAQSDWDRAASVMERFVGREPGDPAALYNLGAIEANRGRVDEATAYWRRVVAEAPGTEFATRAAASLDRVTRGE